MAEQWTVDAPRTLELPPVRRVRIHVVAGSVDVVATSGTPRLEVTEVDGDPLRIELDGERLTLSHEQLSWNDVLSWITGSRRPRVVLSLAVPPEIELELGLVSADATVAGITGRTSVRSVSGQVTLDGCAVEVGARTVSGDLEARGLDGTMRFESVSGDLVLADASGGPVRAKTVSGTVALDLVQLAGDLAVSSVSGDVTMRVPATAGLDVDVRSTSGRLGSAFDGLRHDRSPGAVRLTGRVAGGGAAVTAKTVSGDVTLLRREPV